MDFLDAQDMRKGKDALTYFHNASLKYEDYNMSFDELLLHLRSIGFHRYFLDSLGASILAGEMTEVSVKTSMTKLADDFKGSIPQKLSVFTGYLSGQAVKQAENDFVAMTGFITTNTITDIKEFTNKNSLMIGIGIGIVLLVYLKVKL